LHRLFARFRQLHGPGPLPPGNNFEKPGAVIAAGQAVADAADGELLVASAHYGLSHPFAAAIVVDGVDIITTSPRRTPYTPGIGPPCCSWPFFSHASCTGFSNVCRSELVSTKNSASARSSRGNKHPDRISRFRGCAADDPPCLLRRLNLDGASRTSLYRDHIRFFCIPIRNGGVHVSKIAELYKKMGPEFAALIDIEKHVDLNSRDGQEIASIVASLGESCPH